MSAIDQRVLEASWAQFYQKIHVQFPHSKVYGVSIRGGAVLSVGRVQQTRLMTREEARSERCAPDTWDAQWRRFFNTCRELRDVDFPEVHFRDGSPQTILMESGGWEFEGVTDAHISSPDFRRMLIAA